MENLNFCVYCGKYIGSKTKCPYCHELQPYHMKLKILKLTSLFIALFGTLILFISAREKDIPFYKIKDITPTMNFAKIKIKGVVESNPFYSADRGGYLTFWVDDGTGTIRIKSYRNTAREIIENEKYPVFGDSVIIIGSLRTVGNDLSLIIENVSDIKIKIKKARRVKLPLINESLVGERIITEGHFDRMKIYKNNSVSIILKNDKGYVNVYIPYFYKNLNDVFKIKKGDIIKVEGVVSIYKGNIEIIPHSVKEIEILSKEKEKEYILKGIIEEGKLFKNYLILNVKVDNKKEKVLLWKSDLRNKFSKLSPFILSDALIEAKVYEKIYKDKKEYIVKDLKILKYPKKLKKLNEIYKSKAGRLIRTKGEIEKIINFKPGTMLFLTKGSKKLKIWIWNDLWKNIKNKIKVGDSVVVSGILNLYKGELELVPKIEEDIFIK